MGDEYVRGTYRLRPREVEAVQYNGSFPLDFLRAGESVSALNADGSAVKVETPDMYLGVYLGGWLVRDGDRLDVLSDEDFAAQFEEAV